MPHYGVKFFAFISLLVVQIVVSLIYKFSQTNGKYSYSTISAITLAEMIKFCISSYLTFYNIMPSTDSSEDFKCTKKLSTKFVTCGANIREQLNAKFLVHTFILAVLYCTNNQITFILFEHTDFATISLFKSFTSFQTAILLWVFFQRPINRVQWCSIVLQVLGLIIMQYDVCKSVPLLKLKLYIILITSCTITSICTAWNEYLLKNYSVNLNVQNSALYFFGTIINTCVYFYFSYNVPAYSKGFFEGYTILAVTVVFCNSILGIVITLVYKYGDAIIKTFSNACATGALLFLNWALFSIQTNLTSCLGAAVIFISSYIYFSVAPAAAAKNISTDANVSETTENIIPMTNQQSPRLQEHANDSVWLSWKSLRVLVVSIIILSIFIGSFLTFRHRVFIPLANRLTE